MPLVDVQRLQCPAPPPQLYTDDVFLESQVMLISSNLSKNGLRISSSAASNLNKTYFLTNNPNETDEEVGEVTCYDHIRNEDSRRRYGVAKEETSVVY